MKKINAFKISLATADLTPKDFAAQIGITVQALMRIVTGKTKSQRVTKIIDDFIVKEFAKLRFINIKEV